MPSSRKKQMLLVILLVAFLAVFIVTATVLLLLDDSGGPVGGNQAEIEFADPSLSVDIYEDEKYMELDRTIYYTMVDGYETTVPILAGEDIHYSTEVRLLVSLIRAAIAGDTDSYNACFSKEYIKASGEFSPFTMQKLYDIAIVDYTYTAAAPSGYVSVRVYGLRYKIKDNNGSLRNDVGSDGEIEQRISVVKDADGKAFIYGINTVRS